MNELPTLILEYSVFEDMDIPSMNLFKSLNNEGFGGSKPVTELKLMDNGDLFFFIRRELIHLTPSPDGKYHVEGKYWFKYAGEELWLSDIFPSKGENEFFISSWYYLFKVKIPGN